MASLGSSDRASYGTVAIGATAGVIKAGLSTRRSILIQNVHATQVLYVGDDSSVATSTGIKVAAGESLEIADYNGPVYGIASGADTDVRYFEVG